MEVVEQLDFLITNTEVKELLTAVEREAKDTSFKRPPIACETSKHVLKYLGDAPSCNTTSAEVVTLMQRLSNFAPLDGQEPLREAEICNIANIRPTSLVALYAMIDKSLDRFGEPKLNEMLDIIARILTAPPDPEGEGAWVGEEVDSMQT